MILVIGSEKGGCGKSTLAINLVVMSAREGIDTLLVDADIQGSCNEFSQRRDELAIAPRIQVMMKQGRNLHRELADLQHRYQRIIVDTGGRDSPELRSSLLVAHTVLLPVQPTQLDLWATEKAFQVTATAQDKDPQKPKSFNLRIDEQTLAKLHWLADYTPGCRSVQSWVKHALDAAIEQG